MGLCSDALLPTLPLQEVKTENLTPRSIPEDRLQVAVACPKPRHHLSGTHTCLLAPRLAYRRLTKFYGPILLNTELGPCSSKDATLNAKARENVRRPLLTARDGGSSDFAVALSRVSAPSRTK